VVTSNVPGQAVHRGTPDGVAASIADESRRVRPRVSGQGPSGRALPRMKSPDALNISADRGAFPRIVWPRPFGLAVIGGIIGVLYAMYMFPPDFLAGSSRFWEAPPTEDLETQISSVRYYIRDAWHFPIFRTVKIDPPKGISIVYTDSLPLFAIAAKFLKGIFGREGNYFGVWLGICYVLQAVSAVMLLASLSMRTYFAAVAAALMAVSAPAFLFRVFHVTLCAHFLVMLALALYFISIRASSFSRVWPWFCVLSWVSLLVQAYIFVMISTILVATATQVAVTRRKGWLEAGCSIGVSFAGALCLMWISGFFWGRAKVRLWEIGRPESFGNHSMNLLSPLFPQWSGLFPGIARFLGATNGPFRDVGLIDATGRQYEGFNYLGAGVLFLASVAVWLDRKNLVGRARKYWGLVAALFVLSALATTHRVYAGKWGITLFDNVPLVLEDIRSSGRLFWPVSYTILAAAIAVVTLRSRRYVGKGLLLVAVVLQITDAAPIRNWVRNWVTHGYEDRYVIPASPWIDLIRYHDEVKIFPTYECAGASRAWKPITELVFRASESGTPVNTTALDRFKGTVCAAELETVKHLGVNGGDLLVFLSRAYAERFAAGSAEYRQLCRSFDRGVVCSRQWPEMDRRGLSQTFDAL
jgi:uncharacterized protein DUF6311